MAMDWRLIHDSGEPAAYNMAVDHALVEWVAGGGRAVLRLYHWRRPTLSLGRNQRARGRVRAERARDRGSDIVRRPTGGAAVYHDHEVTYAVAAPVGALGSPRETYEAVNRAIIAGLRVLGVSAGLSGAGREPGDDASPICFGSPVPGEVIVDGRKLVGSAQRRYRRALLQHGSILISGGQDVVADLIEIPDACVAAEPIEWTPEPRIAAGNSQETVAGAPVSATAATLSPRRRDSVAVATLEGILGRTPAPNEVTNAITAGFEEVLGIRFARADRVPDPGRVAELTGHYESEAWTWRR